MKILTLITLDADKRVVKHLPLKHPTIPTWNDLYPQISYCFTTA
jgi:hypothetical protein